jgi:WD40 repeat protein
MQKPKEMELRTLNKRHAFGIKSDVYGCVHWLDENTLAYPVGRNVVMHNVHSNAQKFFLTSEKTDAITAIAISPNKKFIAIAESGEHPQVQIVDTNTRKRRKVLNVTDLGSDRFVCLQFSGDGRHLATQGGAPQWNLLYWNWERSKPLAQTQVTREQTITHVRDNNANLVTHVTINPRDPLHIVVSGNGLFRFYRYVDGLLKSVPGGLGKAHTQNFTTHAWVTEDRIIVATENAELLLIEDGEFRCPLPTAPQDNHGILALIPTSRGFVCGGEMGFVTIFEQSDDKDIYRRVKALNIESREREVGEDLGKKSAIRAFALTQGEDTLAMATSSQQILGLSFNVEWSKVSENPIFQAICQPFHSAPIVGLDTCVRKPLVATSSADKTVRIWNIQEHTVEIIKHFPMEPGAVALHPSGLHILVCFQDKVRFMNLYGDNIQEFKAFNIRSVSDARFSVGGQYFALTHSNLIQIFNTSTCDATPIGQLRGHTQRVKNFQWCAFTQYPTDTRLVSCSLDGWVFDWNIKDMRKENDHQDKRFQYHAIASDDKNIWVVGAPASAQADTKWKVKLRELDLQSATVTNDYEFPDLFINSLVLAPQHRLLFGGCSDGSVKLMTFPLQGGIHDPPVLTHAASISKMAISFDESMLFTVGMDGSFYIFDVKEDGRTTKRESTYADEILISRSDLEEKNAMTANLRQTIEDMKTEMEGKEKRRSHEHGTRIRERTEQFKSEAAGLAAQFASVWNAKVEQERAFAEIKREKAEEFRRQCDVVEKAKQAELQQLEDRCKDLRQALESNRLEFLERQRQLEDNIEKDRRIEEEKFQEKLNQQQENLQKLENQVMRNTQTHRETRYQLEMDTDAEIEGIRKKNEDDLLKLREKYLHMKGEGAIMKKNAVILQKEIDARAQEVRALDATKAKLSAQIKDLNSKIAQLRQDIDDRDLTIGEKEKKIYELKKRNQDLEKHKFVLDHRIRQLKSQIEPKQMEIAKENEKIKIKDQELEQFHRNNLALRSNIEDLKEQISRQQMQIKTYLNRLKDFETYKSRVRTDIGELAQLVQDPEQLNAGIDKMYAVHVTNRGGKRCAALEEDLKEEFETHTEFLAKTVESLKRKVQTDQEQHKADISSVMVENLALIKEIHELRKEIRNIRNSAPIGECTNASSQTLQPRDAPKEIEHNRVEIQRLRGKIEELEKQIASKTRPASGRLPPM